MTGKDNDNSLVPMPENEGSAGAAGLGEILLYQTEDGRTRVECRFQDDTIWLSQAHRPVGPVVSSPARTGRQALEVRFCIAKPRMGRS